MTLRSLLPKPSGFEILTIIFIVILLVGAGVELLFEGEFQHAARDADALGDLLHLQFGIREIVAE